MPVEKDSRNAVEDVFQTIRSDVNIYWDMLNHGVTEDPVFDGMVREFITFDRNLMEVFNGVDKFMLGAQQLCAGMIITSQCMVNSLMKSTDALIAADVCRYREAAHHITRLDAPRTCIAELRRSLEKNIVIPIQKHLTNNRAIKESINYRRRRLIELQMAQRKVDGLKGFESSSSVFSHHRKSELQSGSGSSQGSTGTSSSAGASGGAAVASDSTAEQNNGGATTTGSSNPNPKLSIRQQQKLARELKGAEAVLTKAKQQFLEVDRPLLEWLLIIDVHKCDIYDSILQTMKYLQYEFFAEVSHVLARILPPRMQFRPMVEMLPLHFKELVQIELAEEEETTGEESISIDATSAILRKWELEGVTFEDNNTGRSTAAETGMEAGNVDFLSDANSGPVATGGASSGPSHSAVVESFPTPLVESVDALSLSVLTAQGFTEDEAARALKLSNNDTQTALDMLLNGKPDSEGSTTVARAPTSLKWAERRKQALKRRQERDKDYLPPEASSAEHIVVDDKTAVDEVRMLLGKGVTVSQPSADASQTTASGKVKESSLIDMQDLLLSSGLESDLQNDQSKENKISIFTDLLDFDNGSSPSNPHTQLGVGNAEFSSSTSGLLGASSSGTFLSARPVPLPELYDPFSPLNCEWSSSFKPESNGNKSQFSFPNNLSYKSDNLVASLGVGLQSLPMGKAPKNSVLNSFGKYSNEDSNYMSSRTDSYFSSPASTLPQGPPLSEQASGSPGIGLHNVGGVVSAQNTDGYNMLSNFPGMMPPLHTPASLHQAFSIQQAGAPDSAKIPAFGAASEITGQQWIPNQGQPLGSGQSNFYGIQHSNYQPKMDNIYSMPFVPSGGIQGANVHELPSSLGHMAGNMSTPQYPMMTPYGDTNYSPIGNSMTGMMQQQQLMSYSAETPGGASYVPAGLAHAAQRGVGTDHKGYDSVPLYPSWNSHLQWQPTSGAQVSPAILKAQPEHSLIGEGSSVTAGITPNDQFKYFSSHPVTIAAKNQAENSSKSATALLGLPSSNKNSVGKDSYYHSNPLSGSGESDIPSKNDERTFAGGFLPEKDSKATDAKTGSKENRFSSLHASSPEMNSTANADILSSLDVFSSKK